MATRVDIAQVKIWGQNVGRITWDKDRNIAGFIYGKAFLQTGIELAPFTMPLKKGVYSFPKLNRETYRGLPGLLAGSLPNAFDDCIIERWLNGQGRSTNDFSPVERLCFTGTRGMEALEYFPISSRRSRSRRLEFRNLLGFAQEVMNQRGALRTTFGKCDKTKLSAMNDIIRAGSSTGGARQKAIIALDPKNNLICSGERVAPVDHEHWIIKFDGILDGLLGEAMGFGRIEMAYYRMAVQAGIEMSECRLLEENGRAHFLTKRFDREADGTKTHIQSLCAMRHYDFNAAGCYSYEQAFSTIQQLILDHRALEQFFRRMVFNLVMRNQDDHTRNTSFLLSRTGAWTLSPAYDITYSKNSEGSWTDRHQMTINGKRDNFTRQDLYAVASQFNVRKSAEIVDEVTEIASHWDGFARECGVETSMQKHIGRQLQLF